MSKATESAEHTVVISEWAGISFTLDRISSLLKPYGMELVVSAPHGDMAFKGYMVGVKGRTEKSVHADTTQPYAIRKDFIQRSSSYECLPVRVMSHGEVLTAVCIDEVNQPTMVEILQLREKDNAIRKMYITAEEAMGIGMIFDSSLELEGLTKAKTMRWWKFWRWLD